MHVFLSGATGFIGSALLKKLLDEKFKITIPLRKNSDLHRISHYLKSRNVNIVEYPKRIEDPIKIDQSIDAVINFAVSYDNLKVFDLIETNILLPLRLLQAAEDVGVKHFYNIATFYPKSLNNYALSKAHSIEWLESNTKNIFVKNIILHHVYGPNDRDGKFVPFLLNQLHNNEPEILLTSCVQLRDFIYIDDVVEALNIILKNPDQFEKTIEIGSGEASSLKCFVEAITQAFRREHPNCRSRLVFGGLRTKCNTDSFPAANTFDLERVGWRPKYTLSAGTLETIKSHLFGG